MAPSQNQALLAATIKLLRPLIRILLRNGVPFGTFSDLARYVYVDLATKEFGIPGRKQTISRAAIITGLTRKEVSRIQELPQPTDTDASERYNRAARVISGWVRDSRFRDKNGQPAVLPLEGGANSFGELVKAFSGDVPPRAVLDELLRTGTVESLPNGTARLKTNAYIPQTEEVEKLGILGTDVRDLIQTIDHNLQSASEERYLQRKVAYDNLPAGILEELRWLTRDRAQALLEDMDRWLSVHDRDTNSSVAGDGRHRAGMGIYYFEEEFKDEGESS
jgi:Family of unknown function (DUF6502)